MTALGTAAGHRLLGCLFHYSQVLSMTNESRVNVAFPGSIVLCERRGFFCTLPVSEQQSLQEHHSHGVGTRYKLSL